MSSMLVWSLPEPGRGPQPALGRDQIVRAAIKIADAEGVSAATMRRVATALGSSTPMSLYRYVGSKDGLTDLMVDEVYGEIEVPAGEWRASLGGLGLSGWAAVQRHPWFARLAFSRPPLGPHALALYDAALAALDPFDLPAAERMGAINTVLGHVFGSGLALLEERAMRERAGLPADEDLDDAARPYLQRITEEGRYPHFIRWANDPGRLDPAPQSFERILEWLLDGIEGTLVTASG
jgi:AcrR family transcriptional regulator